MNSFPLSTNIIGVLSSHLVFEIVGLSLSFKARLLWTSIESHTKTLSLDKCYFACLVYARCFACNMNEAELRDLNDVIILLNSLTAAIIQ